MKNNKGFFEYIICGLIILVVVIIPLGYVLYIVGTSAYEYFLLEMSQKKEVNIERIEEEKRAAEAAASESERIAQEMLDYYNTKYEGKIYEELFGKDMLIVADYEYLGIVYDVYKCGAMFVRKSDDKFSVPEVMEYNDIEYPVVGIIGKYSFEDVYRYSPTDSGNDAFYLWAEETFPENWKYLINVCFANGLTKVVIPETVEYYSLCQLPSSSDIWLGRVKYVNETLEEIVIESKFNPETWCFHKSYEAHCYGCQEEGYEDIYNEEYHCVTSEFTSLGKIYSNYSALKKVTIPSCIKSIPSGYGAWGADFPTFNLISVNQIDVPSTVTYVNLSAFDGVPLKDYNFYSEVTYDGGISGWKMKEINLTSDYSFPGTISVSDCSKLETLNICATTRETEQPAYKISNCKKLKTVFIDSGDLLCSVSISGCKNLETVTIKNLPPNGCDNMFSDVNKGFTLKVPAKYVDYYSTIYEDLNVVSCD